MSEKKITEKMEVYNLFAAVPDNAKKPIGAGRLKGMTDINPMWRIMMLTERYGACGTGWKYVITDKQIVPGADGVVCVFLDIDLYVKDNGEWSEAIPGTGGSQLVSKEKGGLYTNDECFKMALTDAISVACKALGMGADVYWETGRTKYDLASGDNKEGNNKKATISDTKHICADCDKEIVSTPTNRGEIWTADDIAGYSEKRFKRKLCPVCQKKAAESQ